MENRSKLAARNQEQVLSQRLAQLPLFQRLGSKQVQVILRCGRSRMLEKGEPLWRAGEPCAALYLLMKGELVLREEGKERDRIHPIAVLGEVGIFSELPNDEELAAVQSSLLLEFPQQSLLAVLRENSDICQRLCRNVVALLSARLQEANERVAQVSRRRTELEQQVKEAEIEVHDLSMIRGLRS